MMQATLQQPTSPNILMKYNGSAYSPMDLFNKQPKVQNQQLMTTIQVFQDYVKPLQEIISSPEARNHSKKQVKWTQDEDALLRNVVNTHQGKKLETNFFVFYRQNRKSMSPQMAKGT